MRNILITGGRGFLGRNLTAHLSGRSDCTTRIFDRGDSLEALALQLEEADIVFHLAGINRPTGQDDFETGNAGFTKQICKILRSHGRAPKIVYSSSVHAVSNDPYGVSKAKAENALRCFASETGASVRIYRLKNLFGKWCRPDYNSVTATFCHNIARDLPVVIDDVSREMRFSYVDDVVAAFIEEIDGTDTETEAGTLIPSMTIQLGELAGRLQAFHEMKHTLAIPDFKCWFNRALYATYLSYVQAGELCHALHVKYDARGCLAEFVKQDHFGQIFISRTKPGVTRGNHYHHTKTEKFLVVEGDGLIRMRAIESGSIEEYAVAGAAFQAVDIPPGVTHSITNVGTRDMVTLFWASEVFNPDLPDTFYLPVDARENMQQV